MINVQHQIYKGLKYTIRLYILRVWSFSANRIVSFTSSRCAEISLNKLLRLSITLPICFPVLTRKCQNFSIVFVSIFRTPYAEVRQTTVEESKIIIISRETRKEIYLMLSSRVVAVHLSTPLVAVLSVMYWRLALKVLERRFYISVYYLFAYIFLHIHQMST